MNDSENKIVCYLTDDERQALCNHKRNTVVVIRDAEKGSAVVII